MNYLPDVSDLRLISPMITLSITGMLVLMMGVFHRTSASRKYLAWISILGLFLAGVDTAYLLSSDVSRVIFGGMVAVDSLSLVFSLILILSGALACLISPAYLESHRMERGEYYALLLFSLVGMITMVSAADLFAAFIGLEMMSIPIYCLAGFFRHSSRSAESAMKYFILGAFASALFLYGIAFFYGITGTTNLAEIARVLGSGPFWLEDGVRADTGAQVLKLDLLPAIAMVMILVAFAFKVAAAPFHMWTPDVYQGAPSSVVGFMATAVKAAAFGALIRVFTTAFFAQGARISDTGWLVTLFWLALFSMVLGNLVAIVQKDVKRMLAYSSIAHAGYLLVGFTAASVTGQSFAEMDAVVFYLLAYLFSTMGAFAVLAWFGKRGQECTTYDDLAGVADNHPGAALAMTLFMLSSAGIPPTAGFVAKFFVFKAAVETGERLFIILAVAGVLVSVAGVYYYLKLIVSMYMKSPRREVIALGGFELKAAMVVCAACTLLLGVLPGSGLELASDGISNTSGLPAEIKAGKGAALIPTPPTPEQADAALGLP